MERKLLSEPGPLLVAAALLVLVIVGDLAPRVAFAAAPFTVAFDFDTGLPTLSEGQNIPFNQTSGEITALFSSPYGPAAFSVQSYSTTFFKLSQFSGKYLYDNKPLRDPMDIEFSQSLTSISLAFATIEYHGGPGIEPTNITLTAYLGSIGTTPIGSAIARGTWPSGDSYPQGTLRFDSHGQPFNLVRIEMPYQGPKAAVDFLVDNVIVTTAGPIEDTTAPVTIITLSGVVGDQGWHTSDATVTLSAADDLSGVAKTEYSFDNVSWATYATSFNVTNEGTTIVYYRSTDTAGNDEAVKTRTIQVDKTVPTGSIVINGDNASTISASVTLTLTFNDALSGVSQVRYSNDGVFDTELWETPSLAKTWTLTAGNGKKTVYFQIKDNAGLISPTYQDSITLETTSLIVDGSPSGQAFPLWTTLTIMTIAIGVTVILFLRKRKYPQFPS